MLLFKYMVSVFLLSCTRLIETLVDEKNVECDRLKYGQDCEVSAQRADDKRTIYFALMLPFPDLQGRPSLAAGFDDGHELAPAAYLGVEQVNSHANLLKEYDVQLIRMDGGCEVTERTVIGANELACSCEPIVGIIGPSCERSSRKVSQITNTKELSLVSINYGGSEIFADRPFSFGILGSNSNNVKAMVEIMKNNEWTRYALLYTESHSPLVEKLLHAMPVGFEFKFSSAIYDTYIPLKEVKQSFSRVIIILATPNFIRRVLCLAHYEELVFPTYQWMFMEAIDSVFKEISFTYDGRLFKCSNHDIGIGLKGGISLLPNAVAKSNSDNTITDVGLSPKEYSEQYESQLKKYANRFHLKSIPQPSEWAKGFYDAVWALAFAINSSLQELNTNLTEINPGSNDLAQIIRKYMFTVNIQGVTGRINFDNNTGFNSDGTINVYQYEQNRTSTKIGSYTQNVFTSLSNATPVFINATFDQVYDHVNTSVSAILILINFIALVLTISAQVVNICYRKHKLIKASSPSLNLLIFIGCYAIIIGGVLHVIAETLKDVDFNIKVCLCSIVPWLLNTGATLIMGTVCMKTWRLHRIYINTKKLRNKKMKFFSNSWLGVFVIALVVCDTFVCILWCSTDLLMPKQSREIGYVSANEFPVITVNEVCYSKFTIYWLMLLFTPKGVLILCSFILALLTRINKEEFRTINIIIMAYLLSILFGLGAPIYAIIHIVGTSISLKVATLSILLNILVSICVLVLFLPPVYVLLKN